MFSSLTDFALERDWKQAIGFYIVWLLVILVVAAILSMLLGMVLQPAGTFEDGFSFGVRVGSVVAFIGVLFFAINIATAKHSLKDMTTILLILLSAALAVVGGGILGMIVPAYLTTRPKKD